MADPVQKPDISSSVPAAKAPSATPKLPPSAPKTMVPAVKEGKAKPKEVGREKNGKLRLDPLNVNLGRSGLPQESAFPVQKASPKAAPKPPAGAKPVPAAKGAPVSGEANPSVAASGQPVLKKATPRAKSHYFIIENLCVGCGVMQMEILLFFKETTAVTLGSITNKTTAKMAIKDPAFFMD